jgi:hypothetical protein
METLQQEIEPQEKYEEKSLRGSKKHFNDDEHD